MGRCFPPALPSCWACRKVVLGAPGPFGHASVVLLKLLARRWLDCFGAVPAGLQFIAETAQSMVQWFVPFAKNGLPLGFRSRSMCSMREPPDSYRPLYLQALPNFLKPLPGETVAALTRHCRTPAPPRVRAGDHQLPQDLWGRRRPPRYAHSPSFWSTGGRLEQDSCASLRGAQPRARRANRAQSTAHH